MNQLDAIAVVLVMVGALAFLGRRLFARRAASGGDVVVGAALQRGLRAARERRNSRQSCCQK